MLLPPLLPTCALPRALKVLPLLTVTAALAVIGAVEAKVVTALTVSVCEPEVPRTALPAAVRVEVELVRVSPAEKLANPELSMVSRSVGWPLLLLVLPAVVVLKTRLPPVLPDVSCIPKYIVVKLRSQL